jgi:Tol biopolymer transport system component/DNA-binding winged helix-turn-helix (wHTH) protein
MASPAATPHVVRFGVFELDLDARELRKSGVKIKLQEQPFLVLAMLLERPGVIITREELQKKLWPKDTFVDFDLSLNSAVKKLRQALSDDSENPRFVETLYRRGYRFIAPVNGADRAGQALPAESTPELAAPHVLSHNPSRFRTIVIVSMIVLAGLLGAAARLRPPLSAPRILSITQLTHDNLPKNQLVTDGPRLYFEEVVNGHQVLSQVSTDGGEVNQIPTPFSDVSVRDVFPSASELLVQSRDVRNDLMSTTFTGPLWMIPLPAGAPRRVGNIVAGGASFSLDGKSLVYGNGQDLYLAQADGGNPRKLTSVSGYPLTPTFSPDGTRVQFTVLDRNIGSASLWETPISSVAPHPMFPAWLEATAQCCGAWTTDGKYFFFVGYHGSPQIWALRERTDLLHRNTSKPFQVTNGPLTYYSPAPSRDGRTLFVVGEQPRSELMRYDEHAGQFTPFLSGISAGQLDFSRDSQFVTYVSFPDGALWRSRTDGSEARQLTYAPLIASMPRWSPDGKRIAFSATSDPKALMLLKAFVISADGGTPQQLVQDDSREYADANWAPDGNSLIFSHGPALGSINPNDFVLVRYDLKTGQLSDVPGSTGFYAPRWSPDGRYVTALTTNQDKLMLLEVATGRWSEVATGQAIEYPSWSHDSQDLFFESTLNEGRVLFRLNLSTRRTEQVLSLAGVRRVSVPFGVQWVGLAPDNSALIMRDVGIREIYALRLELR